MPAVTSYETYIVDDSEAIRDSLSDLFRRRGVQFRSFGASASFLQALDGLSPGCVLLDLRMAPPDGLAVLAEVIARRAPMAIVIMTGHAEVELAVRTLHMGAIDFVEKPIVPSRLLESLERAGAHLKTILERRSLEQRMLALTRREREVLRAIVDGGTSKEIAIDLGISHRTVESHRANIMGKLDVDNLAELVRLADTWLLDS